jgi:murein DD-endopeptidase MepM/ murein hydrolase activator NlpD
MAIFMSFCLILLGVAGIYDSGALREGGILGGPGEGVVIETVSAGEPPFFMSDAMPTLVSQPAVDNMGKELFSPYNQGNYEYFGHLATSFEGSPVVVSGNSPVDNVIIYRVKQGDTIPKIAKTFAISQEVLAGANPSMKGKTLRAGQELTILLIAGVIHQLKGGETPDSVASAYGVSLESLQLANRGVDFNKASTGVSLVIPGAHSIASQSVPTAGSALPNLVGYFKIPTEGFNWGKLHAQNAVDIANACGTPVVASAEGLVVPGEFCDTSNGWNGGYGECITLEHPNGTKTRYAHLSEANVSVGDYVAQGKVIGAMGDSGEATGCHIHFEVEGARNPFVK